MEKKKYVPPTYMGDDMVMISESDVLLLTQYAAWYAWSGITHCRKNKIDSMRYEEKYVFVNSIRDAIQRSKDDYTWKPKK